MSSVEFFKIKIEFGVKSGTGVCERAFEIAIDPTELEIDDYEYGAKTGIYRIDQKALHKMMRKINNDYVWDMFCEHFNAVNGNYIHVTEL